MRSRAVAMLGAAAVGLALAVAGCAQATETSSGVLVAAPAPTVQTPTAPTPIAPTPAEPTPAETVPTPTAPQRAGATPTPTPTGGAGGESDLAAAVPPAALRSTPLSVQRITAGEQISADDLAAYIAWIEAKLERPLVEVPTVTGIDRDQLIALVPEGRFVPGDTWELLVALGLVDANADRLAADEVRRLDVRGACCPIVVRDTASPALNEMLLVHELTHAADDPGGGLATQRPREFIPMSIALVEGNAHRVAFDYANDVLSLTYPDFELPSPVFTDPEHPDLPVAVRDLIEFPYDEGQSFVRGLAERGGEAAVLDAFGAPPTTSEHIIDIDSYLADEAPLEVDTPAAPDQGEVVSAGTLGAFVLEQVLGQTLDHDAARQLAQQWDGDSYILFREGQRRCISLRVVAETNEAATRLVAILGGQAESPNQLTWLHCSDEVPARGGRSE